MACTMLMKLITTEQLHLLMGQWPGRHGCGIVVWTSILEVGQRIMEPDPDDWLPKALPYLHGSLEMLDFGEGDGIKCLEDGCFGDVVQIMLFAISIIPFFLRLWNVLDYVWSCWIPLRILHLDFQGSILKHHPHAIV
ncbi:unnamed protein product [Cuscuta campestris]|uniref:Uncharacterized protein n=1 Tax=Cuscuta campestris TaxID=132261 RepID=A0A484M4I3_9ASTE|nr:unnamed protein product [Cuscuta campestris]